MMDYGQALFLYTAAIKIADVLTVLGVWYLSWYLRFYSNILPIHKGIPELSLYSRVALPLVLVFSAAFHLVGAYRKDRIHFGFRSFKKTGQGAVTGALLFIAVLYFFGEFQISRIYLILFITTVICGLTLERFAIHSVWRWVEGHLINRIRVLLVGSGELLQMYVQKIALRKPYPVEWVGRIGRADSHSPQSLPVFGEEDKLLWAVHEKNIDLVVISYPTEETQKYAASLELLSNELVGVKVLPDFGRFSTFSYKAEQECGMPLLVFNQAPVSTSDRFIKRIEDILGSLVFLVLFSPLYLFLIALIKLTSKGPAFFSQVRMGADGKIFNLYKFRSMQIGAENKTGAVWAVENDPRTTSLGKWLRKSSLDEIPQFYNVLRGDMSLVGPRPERPVFVDQFKKEIPKYMLRHKMKSGITGWAQVNGWRGNTSIEERIKHDLFYIGHWSHYFDVKILVLTLLRGFVHRNAY